MVCVLWKRTLTIILPFCHTYLLSVHARWDGCCKGYPHQSISYTLDRPHTVNGYNFATQNGECPVAWTLETSVDGKMFTPVDHRDNERCHPKGAYYTYIHSRFCLIPHKLSHTADQCLARLYHQQGTLCGRFHTTR